MSTEGQAPGRPARAPSPLDVLQRFRQARTAVKPGERCEMCATEIPSEHSHIVNLESRALLCGCRACYLLFTQQGAAQGKFRAVPDRYLFLPSFVLDEARWDALQIPVRMAFFFHNSAIGKVVALYPSPAGATESTLPLESWESLRKLNPVLGRLTPDVEALLVFGRRGESRFACYVVPIDACYELTGAVRRHWRGFDGGEEAWRDIEAFFARVHSRSREADA